MVRITQFFTLFANDKAYTDKLFLLFLGAIFNFEGKMVWTFTITVRTVGVKVHTVAAKD